MKRISSLLLAAGMTMVLAAPAGAYEAFKGFLGVLQDEPEATPGYVLVCHAENKNTYLMDKQGNVVHSWPSEWLGFSAELLPNGNLARAARLPTKNEFNLYGGSSGRLEEFDWDGNLVWSHDIYEPGKEMSHHTFEVMPNGNYMFLVWEHHTYEEAVAKGLNVDDPNRNIPRIKRDGIWCDMIREVDRDHNTVWEFRIWDNTGDKDDYTGWNINRFLPITASFGESGSDWTHCNGVAYNPRTKQVTFTSRALGEVYVVDYATRKLVYRWGNPYNYGAGELGGQSYGNDNDQRLFGPHAPDWTADDTITVLHNATNRPTGPATGFYEIDPVKDSVVFEWGSNNVGVQKGTYYSSHQSGINKMPNGHYLLTLTTGSSVIEIAPDKSIVWEFVNPVYNDTVYYTSSDHGSVDAGQGLHKAMFYPVDFSGFKGKDMTTVQYKLPNWVEMLSENPVEKRAAK